MNGTTESIDSPADDRMTVVYGLYPQHGFALLEQEDLWDRSKEMGAIAACETLGDLRALAPSLRIVGSPVPFDDGEYLGEEIDDSQPFDWLEAADNSEGDWPVMPTALVLDWATDRFLDALKSGAGATVVSTTFNGHYLEMLEEREGDLRAVLEALGVRHVRDDAAIGFVGALWDAELGRSRVS